MPHQCLSCGFAFEEGSSALLAGCPECQGTRFFYSKDPVDADKRKEMAAKASKDLRNVVAELLMAQAPETAAALADKTDSDGWATLKPRDVRRLVRQAQKEAKGSSTAVAPEGGMPAASDARARLAAVQDELAAAAADEEARPDTVTVKGAGEYEIDVRGLLERNPIVVHKDGSYVIHLPSLFEGRKQR